MQIFLTGQKRRLAARSKAISAARLKGMIGTDGVDNPYLAGAHNAQNAAFAVAIAQACGIADAAIQKGLPRLKGLHTAYNLLAQPQDSLLSMIPKRQMVMRAPKRLSAYHHIIWLAGGRAKADGLK